MRSTVALFTCALNLWAFSALADERVTSIDLPTGVSALLSGSGSAVRTFRFSSKGHVFSVSHENNKVDFWTSGTTPRFLRSLEGIEGTPSPSGEGYLLSRPMPEKALQFFRAGEYLQAWTSPIEYSATELKFSADGTYLTMAGRPNTTSPILEVRKWSDKSLQEPVAKWSVISLGATGLSIAPGNGFVSARTISGDSPWGDNAIAAVMGKPFDGWTQLPGKMVWSELSPDGMLLFLVDNKGVFYIRDNYTGEDTRVAEFSRVPTSLAISSDGKQLAVAGLSPNAIDIWDLTRGIDNLRHPSNSQLKFPGRNITALAYTPRGNILSGNEGGEVFVWNPVNIESHDMRFLSRAQRTEQVTEQWNIFARSSLLELRYQAMWKLYGLYFRWPEETLEHVQRLQSNCHFDFMAKHTLSELIGMADDQAGWVDEKVAFPLRWHLASERGRFHDEAKRYFQPNEQPVEGLVRFLENVDPDRYRSHQLAFLRSRDQLGFYLRGRKIGP
jgi:WD40 repeat protein